MAAAVLSVAPNCTVPQPRGGCLPLAESRSSGAKKIIFVLAK
jgi:hypothetical protein